MDICCKAFLIAGLYLSTRLLIGNQGGGEEYCQKVRSELTKFLIYSLAYEYEFIGPRIYIREPTHL